MLRLVVNESVAPRIQGRDFVGPPFWGHASFWGFHGDLTSGSLTFLWSPCTVSWLRPRLLSPLSLLAPHFSSGHMTSCVLRLWVRVCVWSHAYIPFVDNASDTD